MPVVLRHEGHRVEFFASDGDEPPHMHVKKANKHAKFWLEPMVGVEFSKRYRPHELNRITKLVQAHRTQLLEAWHDFFRG